jgi:oxygen-independent coproporphyrinogen-3 oxidase
MGELLAAIRQVLPGVAGEVTLEANPIDCTAENLAAWADVGVTRLSIGVQSLVSSDLVVLGRDHRMGDGREAVERARHARFASISADLILAVPGASGEPGATELAALGPHHLSVYELTYEPGTPLTQRLARGELSSLGDDIIADLYSGAHDRLVAMGYEHYEVSSYGRPGHRSRHNQLYWTGASYLGLGSGAASLVRLPDGGGVRRRNPRSVKRYLAGHRDDEREVVLPSDMARDLVWLGLRTADGVEVSSLAACPGVANWLVDNGLATLLAGRIRPTLRGFLHSDAVARRVVAGWR